MEEKHIPYTIEKINMRCYGDKPREYTAKVTNESDGTFGPAWPSRVACYGACCSRF